MGQMVLAQSQKSVSQSEKRKKALAESNQFHFLKRVEITNREKSKTRAKVEHVFGAWVNERGGKLMCK